MKIERAIQVCQEYHKKNSGRNTIESYSSKLTKLRAHLGKDRESGTIASVEILSCLAEITAGGNQQTKHGRKAFFNFINTNLDSGIQNPCDAPMLRKIYRPGKPIHWDVVEEEAIDEVIFRTTEIRNRLILELMARGGMTIGGVLKLTTRDVGDRKETIPGSKERQGCGSHLHPPQSY